MTFGFLKIPGCLGILYYRSGRAGHDTQNYPQTHYLAYTFLIPLYTYRIWFGRLVLLHYLTRRNLSASFDGTTRFDDNAKFASRKSERPQKGSLSLLTEDPFIMPRWQFSFFLRFNGRDR